jgi:SPX domain protein involved in polyphosphate accumulation
LYQLYNNLQKIFDYLYCMSTIELLKEINRLPLNERLSLLEKAIKDIIKHNDEQQMTLAAESLENEYRTNEDLAAFSKLDFEDFYEAK